MPHFTWGYMAYDTLKDYTYIDTNKEWPFLSKGWIYQEQVLSRRRLQFIKKNSPGNAMGKVTVNAIRRAINNPSMLRAKDNL